MTITYTIQLMLIYFIQGSILMVVRVSKGNNSLIADGHRGAAAKFSPATIPGRLQPGTAVVFIKPIFSYIEHSCSTTRHREYHL